MLNRKVGVSESLTILIPTVGNNIYKTRVLLNLLVALASVFFLTFILILGLVVVIKTLILYIVYNIMIKRKSLKSQIIDAIWELILDGEIEPNDPIRETNLAELLNVSRTPLREALQKLEGEGIVTSEPGKGFRLSKFSEQEIKNIYQLRAKLESFALELSGVPSKEIIEQLNSINMKMLKTKSPKKLIELDDLWHDLLISNCTNKKLMKMIKILRRQSHRYEYAYMNTGNEVQASIKQHEKIIISLKKENIDKASKLFAENNVVGVDFLIEWLKSNNKFTNI